RRRHTRFSRDWSSDVCSSDLIDVRPYGRSLPDQQTTTLIKTDQLEVLRLVLPAGKAIPPHRVSGEITVQCLEGSVEFIADGKEQIGRASCRERGGGGGRGEPG